MCFFRLKTRLRDTHLGVVLEDIEQHARRRLVALEERQQRRVFAGQRVALVEQAAQVRVDRVELEQPPQQIERQRVWVLVYVTPA